MSSYFVKLIALLLFILSLPLYPILFFVVKIESEGPFIFKQRRLGKDKKIFTIYKVRTMYHKPTSPKYGQSHPGGRHSTIVGRYLRRTRLDELPQLLNIVKGDMAFVGPRPFPLQEALKIPKKFDKRYDVLPGLTGSWVIQGFHSQPFQKRMELDCKYAARKSTSYDTSIILKTIKFMLKRDYLEHSED